MIFYYTYITFLVTEKKDGDAWVKVWNSFSDFENEKNGGLINKASYYASLIATEELEL